MKKKPFFGKRFLRFAIGIRPGKVDDRIRTTFARILNGNMPKEATIMMHMGSSNKSNVSISEDLLKAFFEIKHVNYDAQCWFERVNLF